MSGALKTANEAYAKNEASYKATACQDTNSSINKHRAHSGIRSSKITTRHPRIQRDNAFGHVCLSVLFVL